MAQGNNQALALLDNRELNKIPIFSGDARDHVQAENWLRRVERLKTTYNWSDEQTVINACNALQGNH